MITLRSDEFDMPTTKSPMRKPDMSGQYHVIEIGNVKNPVNIGSVDFIAEELKYWKTGPSFTRNSFRVIPALSFLNHPLYIKLNNFIRSYWTLHY